MIKLTVQWNPGPGYEALEQARKALADTATLHAVLEVAAAGTVKRHLTEEYAGRVNKLGGASTGYWKNAIEGTTSASDGEGATVSINQVGVKMKYHGGVITASGRPSEVTGKPIRFLTIPVHPAAHGRTIADLGGKGAFYIVPFGAGGGLKEGGSGAGAGVFKKTGGKRTASDPLYYVLKKSVKVTADPNILPPDEAVLYDCLKALAAILPGD